MRLCYTIRLEYCDYTKMVYQQKMTAACKGVTVTPRSGPSDQD